MTQSADTAQDQAAEASGAVLFDSAIGRCGVAWRDERVVAVQLPERSDQVTLARLRASAGFAAGVESGPTGEAPATGEGEPPPAIRAGIAAMIALLAGQPVDLDFVDVDVSRCSDFDRAVYQVTRAIPPGQSLTYGEVAKQIGEPGAAQAVGRSLGANPSPIVIPCHRVLGADGKLTGFSANGGVETKRKMLLIEGCPAVPRSLFD